MSLKRIDLVSAHAQIMGYTDSLRHLPKELLDLPKPFKSGLVLTDPSDPRYQHIAAFRKRIGETLHRAAAALKEAGESDNSVDTIKILVTTIGTYLTAYGLRSKAFAAAQSAYSSLSSSKRIYDSQRKHHRGVYMAALSVHSQNRLSSLAYYRVRSGLDDQLIIDMLDFCLSPFVRVRRSAQSTLDSISRLYRGTWVLCFPTLFDALQPGTDPDRMKGALYVLRYNGVGIGRICRDWRQLVQLAECLLNAHHENKASVQALVHKATEELISGMKEPNSHLINVHVEQVDAAALAIAEAIRYKPDADLVKRTNEGVLSLFKEQDDNYDMFIDRVIAITQKPQMNWRYQLQASRFLYNLLRRDRPSDERLVKYFLGGILNPHPRIRDYGLV